MNLTFILHVTEEKKDKLGLYPIKAQLDCNGERSQFGINKQRCLPEHWCKDLQRTKNAPNSAYINLLLDRVQERFAKVQLEYEQDKQRVSVKELQRILQAREPAALDLVGMIDKFVSYYEALAKAGKVAEGTHSSYLHKAKIWKAFFRSQGIYHIAHIKTAMQDELGLYVINQGNSNNYACDVIVSFKAFLNYAIMKEWAEKNVFAKITWRKNKTEKVYLEASEIEAIRALDLSKYPRLQQARDIFLVSCATGLAYSDLKALSKEQVRSLERDYLFVERQKTGIQGYIPLFEEASILLKKYDYSLNVQDSKTYNRKLKSICKLAGITKHVTSHTGRKTFGNIMLNTYNVPLEVVSNMMCHADVSTTAKHYTTVQLEKVRQNTAHLK